MRNILTLYDNRVTEVKNTENQIDEVAKLLSDLEILVGDLCKIDAKRLARFTGFRDEKKGVRGAACIIRDVVSDLEKKRVSVQSAARGF